MQESNSLKILNLADHTGDNNVYDKEVWNAGEEVWDTVDAEVVEREFANKVLKNKGMQYMLCTSRYSKLTASTWHLKRIALSPPPGAFTAIRTGRGNSTGSSSWC